MISIKRSFAGVLLFLLLGISVPAQKTETPVDPKKESGEKKDKTLTKVVPLDGDFEPVRITCQNFPQGDDWLKHLNIEIENTTDKPIDYLECVAMICDIKNVDYCVAIPLIYGKVATKSVTLDDIKKAKPLGGSGPAKAPQPAATPIPPGGRVKLTVSETAFNGAKQTLEKNGTLTSINGADLLVGRAHHIDGSAWFNESMLEDGVLGKFRTDSSAFLVAKQSYVWGHLRDRTGVQADIYSGMAVQEDEKGGKSRIQGFNRKIPRNGRRIIVFSSGGG
jgi:hypothetical protein